MKQLYTKLLFTLFAFLIGYSSYATHIVGGTITYQHLGGSTYRVTLKLYRDCSVGSANFDANITIEVRGLNGATFTPSKNISIPLITQTILNPFVDTCVIQPNICVEEAIYTKVVNIFPPAVGGYHLYYARCCRNATITNLVNPLATGMDVYTYIPDNGQVLTNSSPTWVNFPPTFICQGLPINFNHAATDADGDSLVYKMYVPRRGCDNVTPNGPNCPNAPTFPGNVATFTPITYQGGYNANNPLGGAGVTINSSGLLNGIPPLTGAFVVGVMCEEWRNGVQIAYIVRDFQFNVLFCPPVSQSAFTVAAACQGANVSFTNASTGVTAQTTYLWNFGDPIPTNDTSNVQSPGSYTYPGLGPYTVTLITNPRTGCADTSTQTVNIAFVNAGFTTIDSVCITNTVNFNNTSVPSSNSTISSTNWNFGDVGSGVNNTSTLTSPSHIFSYPGTYTVSLIVNTTPYGCADTITKVVKVLGIPIVTARDTVSCLNALSIGVIGTILNAPGGSWTTLGSGSFSPSANVLNPTYTPSSADTTAGFVTLVLTSAGNTMCPGTSDTMQINFFTGPTIYAGSNMFVCKPAGPINLCGTVTLSTGGNWSGIFGTNGSITPATQLCGAVYTPSGTDQATGLATLLLSSTGNGNCTAVKDTIRIFFTDPPTSTAASTDSSCVTQSFSVSGTSSTGTGYWATSGTGTFADTSLANTTYTPSPSDVTSSPVTLYYITTNNAGCAAANDSTIITLVQAPTAMAGNDTVACLNSTTVTLNGQVIFATGGTWTSLGGGTLNPPTGLNPQYTPTAGELSVGTATLVLTASGLVTSCPSAPDTIVITYNPAPSALANATGDTIFVCRDTSSVPLLGSVNLATGGIWTTPNGGGSFNPDTLLSTTYIPVPGDITTNNILLILTTTGNSFCLPSSDTVVVNFYNAPTVAVTAANDSSCVTQPFTVNAVPSTGTGYWTTSGNGTFSPSINSLNATYTPGTLDSGVVTLYFNTTNNNGCRTQFDSVNIQMLPGPLAILGADSAVCNTSLTVQVTGSTSNAVGFIWSTPGTGTFSPPNNLTTNFTGSAQDSINGYAIVICTPIGLLLTCPAAPDTLRIDFLVAPTAIANASGDTIVVCKDTTYVPLNGQVLVATGGVWTVYVGTGTVQTPTALTTIYTPTASDISSGLVTLILSTSGSVANCNNDQDTVYIKFKDDAIVTATSMNDSICSTNGSILINGTSTSGGGYWTTSGNGTFSPNDTLFNPAYTPGTLDAPQVTLIYHSLYACREIIDSVIINVVPGPVADFTNTAACLGQAIQFFDASTGGPIVSWNWNFGVSGTSTLQNPTDTFNTTPQTATLIVINQLGCADTVTKTIGVFALPNADFTADDWIAAMNQQVNFTNLSAPIPGSSWNWNFGNQSGTSTSQDPNYAYPIGGTYSITLVMVDSNGCRDSITKEIIVVLPPIVPNAFTPNGDGHNDIFYPRGGPFSKMHMRIYNNWGELIFETHELKGGWDGTYKDVPQLLGVYVWVVDAETENRDAFHDSGDVTLLR